MELGLEKETVMDFGMREGNRELLQRVKDMIQNDIMLREDEYRDEVDKIDRWQFTPRQRDILEGLKARAKAAGLWNFWHTDGMKGAGLTTVEYAYFAEEMGKTPLAAEVFNCNAPDTGNMEVFHKYGSPEMKRRWLEPLLEGKIRSAYLMTEPDVASSDATNISMQCIRDGDEYVLDGEKWWASGAGDPRCAVYIVMAKTGTAAPKHKRHSMIVVPADANGIEKLRPMHVYGHDDAPHGHMHIRFTDVRVPAENMLLGEGRGFEIAQGRLGPGRIHHCMRAIGQAEAALELMCRRSLSRQAFGKPLHQLGANHDIIAECRMEIEQARLLCLKAAWMMDQGNARAAAPWIHQIKVIAPRIALKIVDEAVQMFGAQGISQDKPLAAMWTNLRTLRLADGPDAVHRRQVARAELKKYTQENIVA
ncbi:MAG: acyl-CoA dehydrogenase family protein [Roseovarius sp.]|nr:acyl-CoA dehydrogenase family protein [Roseovarius sp.]